MAKPEKPKPATPAVEEPAPEDLMFDKAENAEQRESVDKLSQDLFSSQSLLYAFRLPPVVLPSSNFRARLVIFAPVWCSLLYRGIEPPMHALILDSEFQTQDGELVQSLNRLALFQRAVSH